MGDRVEDAILTRPSQADNPESGDDNVVVPFLMLKYQARTVLVCERTVLLDNTRFTYFSLSTFTPNAWAFFI